MRLQRLELRNFKAFLGDHTIVFPDRGPKRPIYLFGGLNGAGKTTLTQAFVTGLHGARAGGLPGLFPAGRDTRVNYARWVAAAFNTTAQAKGVDEMRVSLTITDGDTSVAISRAWWFDAAGSFEEEQLEVREHSGDSPATLLVDDAAQELVDEIIPRHLLDFAVFDGEQVRRLDDTLSAGAVRNALDRLLDLDAVERTRVSLQRLIRDRRLELADAGQRDAYTSLKRQLQELDIARAQAETELAASESTQERLHHELDQLAAQLDSILAAGAPAQVATDLSSLRERRASLRSRLGRHIGDWLYLLPAAGQITDITAAVDDLQASRHGRDRLKLELETVETVAERVTTDQSLLKRVGPDAGSALREWFARDTELRQRGLDQATIDADGGPLSQLSDGEIADVEAAASTVARDLNDVQELAADYLRVDARIRELEDLLQTADGDTASARVLRRRDELNKLLGEYGSSTDQHRAEVERLDAQAATLRGHVDAVERRLAADDDDVAWLSTAESTVAALTDFLAEGRAQASIAVQDRMLANLRTLLRKQSLVTNVVVDPFTHITSLLGPDGRAVELPSAAEHQLAAMAFIDAVLSASDVALPMFVDTPLARLDSHHRRAIVRDFWPNSGRQVIVLSTDEEVVGQVLSHTRRSIAASYKIDCDRHGRSSITAGEYLEELR